MIDLVLSGLTWKSCLDNVDDICIFANDFSTHVKRLAEVFDCLKSAGLKLKFVKCSLLKKQVLYLGHIISADGVSPDPEKVEKSKELA